MEEEVPDTSTLFKEFDLIIPTIVEDFYSFVSSRGRDAEGKELGLSISRLTSKLIPGAISKTILTGDPYTDAKTILFQAKYRYLSWEERKLLQELLETIEEEEFNKLYELSKGNDNRRMLMIYSGRLNQVQKNDELKWASENGHLEVVRLLIANGADVHAGNDFALELASKNGHLEVVRLLVSNGANVNAMNDNALRLASKNGHLEVVRLLIDNGANVNARDNYALESASTYGHLEIVRLLVANGANVNAMNDNALRLASYNGHLEIVRFLVANGANIHAEDDEALRWALQGGHYDVAAFLQSLP
jgi:hypothetical protein